MRMIFTRAKYSDFLHELMGENEYFSDEQFWTKLRESLEEGGRETAPVETVPAPSARIGMFIPSSAPELRGRENLAMVLERFYTWASVTGCDSALDSELTIKTSGTPRAELQSYTNTLRVRNSCTGPKDFGMYEGTRKQRRATPHE